MVQVVDPDRSPNRHILVVEGGILRRRAMADALSELPHAAVVAAGSLRSALAEIQRTPPELVVSELALPDGSGLDLMPQLGPLQAGVVFVGGNVAPFRTQLARYPDVSFIKKPLTLTTLKETARQRLDARSRGADLPFPAVEYIQLACMGRHSVHIVFDGAGVDGSIFVVAGRLWAAFAGQRKGLAALRALPLHRARGVRCRRLHAHPGAPNLPDQSWEHVLLGLARNRDEGTREMKRVGGTTIETPRVDGESEGDPDEELDFSDLVDAPPQPHSGAARNPDRARWEGLLEQATEALLRKDYRGAQRAYERAQRLGADDAMIRANLIRLRQLSKP